MKANAHYLQYWKPLAFSIPLSSTCLESCKQHDVETVNEYHYYPLSKDQYSIFDVRQITYSSGQDSVMTNWQEKNEIINMSSSSDASTNYLVSLSTRSTSSGYWQKTKEISIQHFPDKISKIFEKTVCVKERSDISRTQYKVAGKYYAENVGLVLSEQADLQYLQKDGEFVGDKIIASGTRRTKKIIEFGNNL